MYHSAGRLRALAGARPASLSLSLSPLGLGTALRQHCPLRGDAYALRMVDRAGSPKHMCNNPLLSYRRACMCPHPSVLVSGFGRQTPRHLLFLRDLLLSLFCGRAPTAVQLWPGCAAAPAPHQLKVYVLDPSGSESFLPAMYSFRQIESASSTLARACESPPNCRRGGGPPPTRLLFSPLSPLPSNVCMGECVV